MKRIRFLICVLVWLAFSAFAAASPYRGTVTFGGLPLPGATITATQGAKTVTVVADQQGNFQFDDLADGAWTLDIEMLLFEKVQAQVTVAANAPAGAWDLKLLPTDQITAQAAKPAPAVAVAPLPPAPTVAGNKPGAAKPAESAQAAPIEVPKAPEENEQSADGLLVQGSVNNAATSQYATNPAFGNTRSGSRGLFTGGFVATEENSALDARQYSVTGVEADKPYYNNFTGVATLFGPLKIPRLLPRGPNFSIIYQWSRISGSQLFPGIVPTQAERSGNLAGLTNVLGQPVTVYNPVTGIPYPNNQVPVSPQAQALLQLYPLPNLSNGSVYNYQVPTLSNTHSDAPQFRLDKGLGRRDTFSGGFSAQSVRSDSTSLFGFVDHTGSLGMKANIQWTHRLKSRVFLFTGYTFSRQRTEVTPNFANHVNISGAAGIAGNDQSPANWGPAVARFLLGLFRGGLSDGNSVFNRNRTDSFTESALIYHSKHNITIGGEIRKQEYNQNSQQNPRGGFTFTGAATQGPTAGAANGSDLADFLIGIPDGSQIAFGNADKYLREPVYSLYFSDDWRVLPILTLNVGARWDYSAPITELFGRLVNLDVSNGFTAVAPVLASNPVGPVSGQHFPSSLIRPEKKMIQPRLSVSWRPIPASTVVVSAGYGIYTDTSVYQSIVLRMVQQAPLSTSVSAQNTAACGLSLATFSLPSTCTSTGADTYGIDPNFRIGYVQSWDLQVRRDLPFALQVTATYTGIKGTHGPQEILPNSYPLGEANPCPACLSGFTYETSNGDSIYHAGQIQLRRRLRAGLAASATYTYSKSIDDDAYMGGGGHTTGSSAQSASLSLPAAGVAQNWLNPRGERSLSSFDQRHLLNAQLQYTTGQGLEGGTLLGGWRGRALKEWTVLGTVTFGSGLPETPIYQGLVPGTGFSNIIRPSLTGASIYSNGTSAHLNAAAYTAPQNGQWGTAGRNSITGPDQLTFTSQMARTFRPHGKLYLDVAVNSSNTLNHVSFTSWNSYVTSTQFGQPTGTSVRSLSTSLHLRF